MRFPTFLALAVATFCLGASGCSDPKLTEPSGVLPETSDGITYSLANEEIDDTPIKTQIEQHIVATPAPTREQLEGALRRRYEVALARRGFKYHNPPTSLYLYIYGTKEQAAAGRGLWIGMISKSASEHGTPRPMIDADRLAALTRKPEVRFGLSEDDRKAAFKALLDADDRAGEEARARISDSAIFKQLDLEKRLRVRYEAEIAKRYKLSSEQLRKVGVEGVINGWPA